MKCHCDPESSGQAFGTTEVMLAADPPKADNPETMNTKRNITLSADTNNGIAASAFLSLHSFSLLAMTVKIRLS
jgi:hypothetical protein